GLDPGGAAVLRREDGDPTTAQALADVVVGVALEQERHAAGEEAPEALAGRAGELEGDRVAGQPLLAVLLRNLAGESRADGAVGVLDRQVRVDLFAALQRRFGERD